MVWLCASLKASTGATRLDTMRALMTAVVYKVAVQNFYASSVRLAGTVYAQRI